MTEIRYASILALPKRLIWVSGKEVSMSRQSGSFVFFASLLGFLVIRVGTAQAYPQYSENGDATNCRACHGDFRANPYISLTEGADWGAALMDVHATDMLSGDCQACHNSGPRFPVLTGTSGGSGGLVFSCAGCHGRAEDGIGSGSIGYGAGLRQHHWVANRTINGISTRICDTCHQDDSDPAVYDTVDESVLPPNYGDAGHPLIPTDPCNPAADGFPEDYAGSTEGLDNDGDGLYDEADFNDTIPCPEPGQLAILLPGIAALLLIARRRQRRVVGIAGRRLDGRTGTD